MNDPIDMPAFLRFYADRLNVNERRLLLDASSIVVDEAFGAIERYSELKPGIPESGRLELFDRIFVATYLPRPFAHRYTVGFFKKFLIAVVSVGMKMAAGDEVHLSSTAEELALNAIVDSAKIGLEVGTVVDADPERLDLFAEDLLEDRDFEMLFSPNFDGIEESPIAEELGVANLRFEEWFEPFRGDDVVHPYLAGGNA